MDKFYIELANAIVIQAAYDYIQLLQSGRDEIKIKVSGCKSISLDELNRFFHSCWFGQLTTIDPDYFIKLLKNKAKKDNYKGKYHINKV